MPLGPIPGLLFGSTKTWEHVASVAFRQWLANSHCNQIHGYALTIKVKFEATHLDERNWVIDFGALSAVKEGLVEMFDHKLLIAQDDPQRQYLEALGAIENPSFDRPLQVADVQVVPATGCEAFALVIFGKITEWLISNGHAPRVRVQEVEVSEHTGNSGYVRRKD